MVYRSLSHTGFYGPGCNHVYVGHGCVQNFHFGRNRACTCYMCFNYGINRNMKKLKMQIPLDKFIQLQLFDSNTSVFLVLKEYSQSRKLGCLLGFGKIV